MRSLLSVSREKGSNEIAMEFLISHDGYQDLRRVTLREYSLEVSEYARVDPKSFLATFLRAALEAASVPVLYRDKSSEGEGASSPLTFTAARPLPVNLETDVVDFDLGVTPDGFVWTEPTSAEEREDFWRRASVASQHIVGFTINLE